MQQIKAIKTITANTPNAINNVIIAPIPNVSINPVRAATNAPAKNVIAITNTARINHKQEQSYLLFSFLQYISTCGSIFSTSSTIIYYENFVKLCKKIAHDF